MDLYVDWYVKKSRKLTAAVNERIFMSFKGMSNILNLFLRDVNLTWNLHAEIAYRWTRGIIMIHTLHAT
jgi:hypothetical protein